MAEAGTTPEFAVGTRVRENDSAIVGEITGRGDYEHEWWVRLASNKVVTCLAENLSAVPAPITRGWETRLFQKISSARDWHVRVSFLAYGQWPNRKGSNI